MTVSPAEPASNAAFPTPRFYVTGGTVPTGSSAYVVRQADTQLLEGLREGRFCYVLNTRQMGKSSLMVRTAATLRQEGYAVAVLDLTAIGQNLSPEQWYDGLLLSLAEQIGLEDELDEFWEGNRRIGPLRRFFEALGKVALPALPDRRLVLFVDEIDAIRSLPFSTDEFFAGIRECYNRRAQKPLYERLTFCLLGVATPSDLIRDTRTTPFNIGQRIELDDFTLEEAAPLGVGLLRGGRSADRLLTRVLYWTGGHPYLTQRLCRAVAEDEMTATDADVDRLCERMFLSRQARETDDNLAFVRNRLLGSDTNTIAVLDLYERVRESENPPPLLTRLLVDYGFLREGRHHRGVAVRTEETDPIHATLRLSGVARVDPDGYLRLRNRIYGNVFDDAWVASSLPDAERERARRAARRAFLQTVSVATVVLAVVASLAVQAVRQSKIAQEQTRVAQRQTENVNRLLYAANLNLAQQAWERGNVARVVELLGDTHESAQRGFEWHYLNRLCNLDLRTFEAEEPVTAVALSPDGRHALTGDFRGRARLWDTMTGKELGKLDKYQTALTCAAFSPDGRRALINGLLWDLSGGRGKSYPLKMITRDALRYDPALPVPVSSDKAVVCGVFSSSGRKVLTGSYNGNSHLWNARTGDLLKTLRPWKDWSITHGAVRLVSVTLSPDERWAVAADSAGFAHLWDLSTAPVASGQLPLRSVRVGKGLSFVAFLPDGERLLTGGTEGKIEVWDRALSRRLQNPAPAAIRLTLVTALALSPDGNQLASSGAEGTLRVWSLHKGQLLHTFKGHTDRVSSIAFTTDGTRLLTGSRDGTARLWDLNSVETGQKTFTVAQRVVPLDRTNLAAAAPNGSSAIYCPWGQIPYLVTLPGGHYLRRLRPTASRTGGMLPWRALAATFSPDCGRIAIAADDNTAYVYDCSEGREIQRLRGHAGPVVSVAFSCDGTRLVTGSEDGTVKLWDSVTGREMLTLPGRPDNPDQFVLFSSKGDLLILGSAEQGGQARRETVTVWQGSTETGRPISSKRLREEVERSLAELSQQRRQETRELFAEAPAEAQRRNEQDAPAIPNQK